MRSRLRLLVSGLVVSISLGTSLAHAQPFPAKPIRIIVPFAPGGNVDVTARVVSAAMSKVLNQSVVVENRTGAGARSARKSP